jgi:tetratricopeptide (TPR) repeat protein
MKPPALSCLRCGALFILWSLAACVTSNPFPLASAGQYSQHIANQDALERAAEAESRLNFSEAGMWMDRYEQQQDAVLDEGFWFHRAAIAERGGDVNRALEVRQKLLLLRPDDVWLRIDIADDLQQVGRDLEAVEMLAAPLENVESQNYALQALVELHTRFEHYGAAAQAAERLAARYEEEGAAHEARLWWQQASTLYEKNHNLRAATLTMEKALVGVNLAEEEARALARLHAFELGEPENVADAIGLVRYHTDPDHRLAGVRYLAREPFPQDVTLFEMVLQDPDPRVVRVALAELSVRSQRGRVQAILPLLENPSPEIKIAALRALGALATLAEVPKLLDFLIPEDRTLFRVARASLIAVCDTRLSIEMDPELEQRRKLRELWLAWEASQLPH